MIPEQDMHALKSLSRAARGGTLDPERLAVKAYKMGAEAATKSFAVPDPRTLNLDDLKKIAFLKAVETCRGNIKDVAALLGIGKTTAYRKARQYGIPKGPFIYPDCPAPLQRRPACAN